MLRSHMKLIKHFNDSKVFTESSNNMDDTKILKNTTLIKTHSLHGIDCTLTFLLIFCKIGTVKPYSFLVNDTTFA